MGATRIRRVRERALRLGEPAATEHRKCVADDVVDRLALVDPGLVASVYRGQLLGAGSGGGLECLQVLFVGSRERGHLESQAARRGDPAGRHAELLGLLERWLRWR